MKKQSVQFFLFYFLYNAALVIYNNYIPLYYRMVCGFSQTQIGTVVSAGPLATVFGMFFFGRLADRMKNRNLLAGILLFLSGALTALYTVTVSFGFFVVLFFVFTLVNAPVLQLADTSAVIFAAENEVSFGNLRLGGSIGYAVTSLVCGYLSARSSQSLFGVALAAYAAAAVAAFLLPHDRQRHTPSSQARTKKAPYRALFCKDIFFTCLCQLFRLCADFLLEHLLLGASCGQRRTKMVDGKHYVRRVLIRNGVSVSGQKARKEAFGAHGSRLVTAHHLRALYAVRPDKRPVCLYVLKPLAERLSRGHCLFLRRLHPKARAGQLTGLRTDLDRPCQLRRGEIYGQLFRRTPEPCHRL